MDTMNLFLDALVIRHRKELRLSAELADKGKYNDAHDHMTIAAALSDAVLLGHEIAANHKEMNEIANGH